MGGPVVVEAARVLKGKVVGLIAVDTMSNVELKYSKEQIAMFTKPLKDDFVKGTRDFLAGFMFHPKSDPQLKEKIILK